MSAAAGARALFLTGPPGSGKTTLLREVLASLVVPAGGFYTEEVRRGGRRVGFRLVTLDGREALLASVDSPGPPKVGKYGVDLGAVEGLGVPALEAAVERGELVVVDEIGKMEMASGRFRQAVEAALDRGPVLGTILLAPHAWADAIKRRPGVAVFPVSWETRERVRERLLEALRAIFPAHDSQT